MCPCSLLLLSAYVSIVRQVSVCPVFFARECWCMLGRCVHVAQPVTISLLQAQSLCGFCSHVAVSCQDCLPVLFTVQGVSSGLCDFWSTLIFRWSRLTFHSDSYHFHSLKEKPTQKLNDSPKVIQLTWKKKKKERSLMLLFYCPCNNTALRLLHINLQYNSFRPYNKFPQEMQLSGLVLYIYKYMLYIFYVIYVCVICIYICYIFIYVIYLYMLYIFIYVTYL